VTSWFAASLGDPLVAGESLSRIEALFRSAHARAGAPPDMAVFVRHESEGRLHCDVRAYFSPASAEIARAVGAEPVDAPARTGLSLLAGSVEAWRALFPSRDA
jgi:hypothetical protein